MTERVTTPEAFLRWSLEARGETCLIVENDTEAPTEMVVWAEEPIDVPDGVNVVTRETAPGTAPAVRNRDVEGWEKYVLEFDSTRFADDAECEYATDGGGKTKKQTAWLRWDWKKGQVNARKTKPEKSDVGTNEFVIRLKLSAAIPESSLVQDELDLAFDVPQPMLENAVAEALDSRSFLDWERDAESIIAEEIDAIRAADDDELEGIVNGLTIQTLRRAKGRPSIDGVESYIAETVGEIREGSA